jgi:hypothetical protein
MHSFTRVMGAVAVGVLLGAVAIWACEYFCGGG